MLQGGRREVGCQWESPVDEAGCREVGCQWESPVDEAGRREVGCQWESPVDEAGRREVGCQSDEVGRNDAGFQVDLLTPQLSWRHSVPCDMAWKCVSVRADEPGGGTLLQYCRSQRTTSSLHLLSPPHRPSLLPTMPLFDSSTLLQPAPALPSLLPSRILGLSWEASFLPPPTERPVSAPPPGLIAPLSPHLAEEEQQDEGSPQHDCEGRFHGNQHPTVAPEKKRQRPQVTVSSVRPGNTSGQTSQLVLKSSPHIAGEIACITRRSPSSALQRKRKVNDGVLQHGILRSDDSETSLGHAHGRVNAGQQKEQIQHSRKKQREEERRPRRTMVGPPIRYLIESEEWSHGPPATNSGRGAGQIRREGPLLKEVEEEPLLEEMRSPQEEEQQEGGGVKLRRIQTDRARRPRRTMVGPPIRYLIESEERSHGPPATNSSRVVVKRLIRKREEESPLKQEGVRVKPPNIKRAMLEQARRKRRGFVSPSDWLSAANHSKVTGPIVGELHVKEVEERLLDERKSPDESKVKLEEFEGGGVKLRWVETEQTRRPRRTMVGPPIRYLVESEEWSHGPPATNHSRGTGLIRREGHQTTAVSPDKDELVGTTIGGGHPEELSTWMCPPSEGRFHGNQHPTVAPEKKRQRPQVTVSSVRPGNTSGQTSQLVLKSIPHIAGEIACITRRSPSSALQRKRKVNDGVLQHGILRSDDSETSLGHAHGRVNAGQQKEQIQHSRKKQREEERRPRRTMVGPPIRYLIESEEWSHGPPATNSGRGAGQIRREGPLLKEVEEEPLLEEMRSPQEEEQQEGGGVKLRRIQTDRARRPRRTMVGPPVRYLIESEERSHGPPATNSSRGAGQIRREGPLLKEAAHQCVKPQGPRTMMVGPPARYLLDLEEGPRVLLPASQDDEQRVEQEQQCKSIEGGGASGNTAMTDRSEEADKHIDQANEVTGNVSDPGGEHLQEGVIDIRERGGASEDRCAGVRRWVFLIYRDLQSGQLTLLPPCSVHLQRVL
ncbi:uncharacterized protein ACBR49_016872 [Aulostomus maculatus]